MRTEARVSLTSWPVGRTKRLDNVEADCQADLFTNPWRMGGAHALKRPLFGRCPRVPPACRLDRPAQLLQGLRVCGARTCASRRRAVIERGTFGPLHWPSSSGGVRRRSRKASRSSSDEAAGAPVAVPEIAKRPGPCAHSVRPACRPSARKSPRPSWSPDRAALCEKPDHLNMRALDYRLGRPSPTL